MLNKEILSFFNEKKILITGGTGMIGRSVAEALSQVNCEIITVSLDQLDISSKNKQIRPDWLVCKINSLISFTPEDMALKF